MVSIAQKLAEGRVAFGDSSIQIGKDNANAGIGQNRFEAASMLVQGALADAQRSEVGDRAHQASAIAVFVRPGVDADHHFAGARLTVLHAVLGSFDATRIEQAFVTHEDVLRHLPGPDLFQAMPDQFTDRLSDKCLEGRVAAEVATLRVLVEDRYRQRCQQCLGKPLGSRALRTLL